MWHVDDVVSLFPFRLRNQNHFHFFLGRVKILPFHSLTQFCKDFHSSFAKGDYNSNFVKEKESKKWHRWEHWVPMRLISVNLGRNCLLADPFEGEGRCMSWDPMRVRKVPSFPHPQEEALTTSLHISLGSSSSCERQVHNSSALVVLERPIYPPWKTRCSSLFFRHLGGKWYQPNLTYFIAKQLVSVWSLLQISDIFTDDSDF